MSEQDELDFREQASRADQIFAAFSKFHQGNPEIWTLFRRFSVEMISRGREHYSSNAVFERIRWHIDLQKSDSELKLNNNFRAYYARLFHVAYPQYDGFFRNRKRTTLEEPAQANDRQEFIGPEAGVEDLSLNRKLRDLL
jgi:hypothetical protein